MMNEEESGYEKDEDGEKDNDIIKSESSDEEEIKNIISDINIEELLNNIETKYSKETIQHFIEQLYYFNSMKLVGNWNIFLQFFHEMDIIDCIGYFAFLKTNGFLEDIHLYKKFDSEKQIQNIDFLLKLKSKTKIQIDKILLLTNIIDDDEDTLSPVTFEIDDIHRDFENDKKTEKNEEKLKSKDQSHQKSDNDDDDVDQINSQIRLKTSKIIKIPKNKYNHYKDFKLVVDKALKFIDHGKKLKWIEKELNIPYTTLRDWRKRYEKDSTYRPYKRCRRTKYFTKEEDENLFNKVKFYMTKKKFNFLNFIEILNEQFLLSTFHRKNPGVKPKFNSQWISKWRKNHRILLRKYHFKRRKLNDPEEVEEFREEVFSAINRYGSRNVYNMDEISWGLVPHDEKVWALRGSDEVVFERNENYPSKYKFTAIATINAAGEKLPIITVAKGKTIRCEKSFQTIFGNIVMYTQNGWSTENLMLAYLQWLSDRCQNSPICLIWDQYKAHMTDKVKEQATKLKIEIIYIPAGQTGSEQPLDKLIFGSMKKTADRLWSEKLLIDEKNLYTKETATLIMLEAWDSIKESTVSKSWNHFFSSSDDLTEINNDFDWVPENEDGDNDD